MKERIHHVSRAMRRWNERLQIQALAQQYASDEPPLRAELFSADQMEQHGRTLAQQHTLTQARVRDRLLQRLADNEQVLVQACDLLMTAVRASRRITPAGEWLLDNFYLIEEQVRTARRHFPKGYSRELPVLAAGPSAGLPRVYDIALEAIAHGDGRVDPENLNRFVQAYQKSTVLKLGELWAIPIMLRLALIENLRRVATLIAAGMIDRNQADVWADQMVDVAEKDPKSLILVIADMARSNPPLVNSFVAELARRLQGQSPALALPLNWVEQRLSEGGQTIERMVQSETQTLAANQVSIANSIGSLRFLVTMDWREFVETMSPVEHKLREDPAGAYARMDFGTRDGYRHVIERIARRCSLNECDVARRAIQLAHEAHATAGACDDERTAHVGYFLIDRGLPQLELACGHHFSAAQGLRRLAKRMPLALFLGPVALLCLLFTQQFWRQASAAVAPGWALMLITGVALVGASQLAVALANWLATLLATPHPLPRLDYSRGIDPRSRTLVVVPTMLVHAAGAAELLETLEVRYLANRDACLHFALLTDFTDANQATLPGDAALLGLLQQGIVAFNLKHDTVAGATFFLLHRHRLWNPQEQLWMGYERKRGKLADLNAFLRSGARRAFALIEGNTSVLRQVKYVITLDTDTQLPRDSAREFAATMAHPLNRPCFDEQRERVLEGYGILQPRMGVSIPSTNRSRYAQLCGSEPGVDPYTRAVSDVYQDLFQEGSFIGKGIYDVEAFEQSLKDRFPENRVLSHDLLEGCHARAGLISDVQLYEDYPSSYSADMARRHRWIRGDWQIAAWLLTRVPGPSATRVRNRLTLLSQWKIFDNLRRSLVAPALVAMLLLGWFTQPAFWLWTLQVLGVIFFPPMLTSSLQVLRKPRDVLPGQHLSGVLRAAGRQFMQAALTLACLPHEAWVSLDAVARTLYRMFWSHRLMLQWAPSASLRSDAAPAGTWGAVWLRSQRAMVVAPALALVCLGGLWWARPVVLWVAAPVLLLWLLAPGLMAWMSLPLQRRQARLSDVQQAFLRQLARRTWGFFETLVTALDHWLPPDNFQEHPLRVLAHRTSPTNIGLALLANLSAADFGYISTARLIERTRHTLTTMQTLPRHSGHFYNWYDTLTLQPLQPLYISAVDSGNLAGHLLTLQPGLMQCIGQPVIGLRCFEALVDTLGVLGQVHGTNLSAHFLALRRELESACEAQPRRPVTLRHWFTRLLLLAQTLDAEYQTAGDAAEPLPAARWSAALVIQCQDTLAEIDALLPWAAEAGAPAWLQSLPGLDSMPDLRMLAGLHRAFSERLAEAGALQSGTDAAWLSATEPLILSASLRAAQRITELQQLAAHCAQLSVLDYDMLYDPQRHLLAVGYNVDQHRRDTGHYDMLASEARLSTFVGIAQGKLPQESWFALSRMLTSAGGEPILLSWSGSMFEYLMPLLVMPNYENTLLDQTCLAALQRQIAYGQQRGVPWGISESGYYKVDAALNYQYRAFGVPGLGLKRGLAEDLVVAPYASALALMVMPEAACQNLQRLAGLGLLGDCGMYEAVDYTPARLPRGQSSAVVRSFMSHHQGMSLLALSYVLLDRPMPRRFEADPLFRASALLLQERIPTTTAFHFRLPELSDIRSAALGPEMPMRVMRHVDTSIPEVQLLSNGNYHVMVTHAGGGYSRWRDLAVTRWREDGTRDHWGAFCYVRDLDSGEFWSTAHQPTLKLADSYEAIFSEGRAEFRRNDHGCETHTEIVVSPEDDMELRRTHITNQTRQRRRIEITSYAEVVLAPAAADALHPAYGNLFVQTEIIPDHQAILCTRRPRSQGEVQPWMFHLVAVHGSAVASVSYETDRSRFIGRTRSPAAPQAMLDRAALSGTQGSVLDPIVAIRYVVLLEPDQKVSIDVVTGVGSSREAVLALVGKHRDRRLADRVFDLAWTHSWVNLQQINATESDAQMFGRLASSVIYANPSLRTDASTLSRNQRGQSGLWGYAISGDLPIVLLQIGDVNHIDLVRQMVQAHAYWRLKGLAVDLVIWNEDRAGYRQALQEQILGLIAGGVEANQTDRPGGIFVRAAEQMSVEDRTLFLSVARVIISDTRGTLLEQVKLRGSRTAREALPALLAPARARPPANPLAIVPKAHGLQYGNGLGGFAANGREYLIRTSTSHTTPAPWSNVMANECMGTVVTESGSAYTWFDNAHEFRATPWANDPVSDPGGEVTYIRDEETGHFWSPTPLPCGGADSHLARHGFGSSSFEHEQDAIASELRVHVDLHEAVKYTVLRLRNASERQRRLSVTGYVEWVLGDLRPKTAMHVVTEVDASSGALQARNPYSGDYADAVLYFDADDAMRGAHVSFTADRAEFIGRNGSLRAPAAMLRARLSNTVGAGLDPCAAIQVPLELGPGEERTLVFRLGRRDARPPIQTGVDAARYSLEAVAAYWADTLGAVQVNTPDAAVNLLLNGWLVYQTLACRLRARSGYYQSGGAYGFRDQLQDAMALVHTEPRLLREHLLRCAGRQFIEGDVQHWWHPPRGRGVRTHCSDDFLWLAQATHRYLQATGDQSVLHEEVPFIQGRPVNAEDDSYFDLPTPSNASATLYQHCVRAISHGLRLGPHGLPLMGSGDWNDGMNLVGMQGQGESVWLAFFLYDTLRQFVPIARSMGDQSFATHCQEQAEALQRHIEQHGWDGDWYRRAYFDDGTPLGSASNSDCQIDSVPQSWAVLSGAADATRARRAMQALNQRLVRRDQGLVQLLTPPFDQSDMNPGYIKGYVPGVRENGGQYTHAAIWVAMAFAAQGDWALAWEVFDLINPIRHGSSAASCAVYKVEPYVVAADVYGVQPHMGRGGWTWYTGSAGWMYRLLLESILGLQLEGAKLHLRPCLPPHWSGFSLSYRYLQTRYDIEVQRQPASTLCDVLTLDGQVQPGTSFALVNDQQVHRVVLSLAVTTE